MADNEFYAPEAAGNDPDTLRRNAKHKAAAAVAEHVDNEPEPEPAPDPAPVKATPAAARKAAGVTRTTAPQDRSATPTQKAAS